MIKLKRILEAKEDKPDKVMEDFASTRQKGAEKITDNAKEKGGLALLTWHHFKVKLPYYEKAANGKLDYDKALEEYQSLLQTLFEKTEKGLNIQQVEFQELVGKLEVLGELLIKHK